MNGVRKTEEYNVTVNNEVSGKKVNKAKDEKLNIFEIFEAIIAAFFVITLIFTFVFRVFSVDGPSMKPTLHDGDKVVVSTIGYSPKKGDIVVLSSTEGLKKPIIKRVIAVAGDKVDINFTTGVVTVNGSEEHYTDELTTQQFDVAFPIVVPEGTVFVLGDNRSVSLDSRSTQVGCVDERLIVGEVLFRFFPLGNWTVE